MQLLKILVLSSSVVPILSLKRHFQPQAIFLHAPDFVIGQEILLHQKIDCVLLDLEVEPDLVKLCKTIEELPIHHPHLYLFKEASAHLDPYYLRKLNVKYIFNYPFNLEEVKFHLIDKNLSSFASLFPKEALSSHASVDKHLWIVPSTLDQIFSSVEHLSSFTLLMMEIDLSKILVQEEKEKLNQLFFDFFRKFLRSQDKFFSLGLGIFLLILPKTSISATQIISHSLQEAIEQAVFTTTQGPMHFQLSIGVSTSEDTNKKNMYSSFEKLVQLASHHLKKNP